MRPHFGYSWTQENSPDELWDLHFYNGGPGHAQIETVRYRALFAGNEDGTRSWIKIAELEQLFESKNISQTDVDIFWLGRAPAIPQGNPRDGFRLGRFSIGALTLIDTLDIEITATDSAGDMHRLIIRSMNRLPLTARKAILAHRNSSDSLST